MLMIFDIRDGVTLVNPEAGKKEYWGTVQDLVHSTPYLIGYTKDYVGILLDYIKGTPKQYEGYKVFKVSEGMLEITYIQDKDMIDCPYGVSIDREGTYYIGGHNRTVGVYVGMGTEIDLRLTEKKIINIATVGRVYYHAEDAKYIRTKRLRIWELEKGIKTDRVYAKEMITVPINPTTLKVLRAYRFCKLDLVTDTGITEGMIEKLIQALYPRVHEAYQKYRIDYSGFYGMAEVLNNSKRVHKLPLGKDTEHVGSPLILEVDSLGNDRTRYNMLFRGSRGIYRIYREGKQYHISKVAVTEVLRKVL